MKHLFVHSSSEIEYDNWNIIFEIQTIFLFFLFILEGKKYFWQAALVLHNYYRIKANYDIHTFRIKCWYLGHMQLKLTFFFGVVLCCLALGLRNFRMVSPIRCGSLVSKVLNPWTTLVKIHAKIKFDYLCALFDPSGESLPSHANCRL